MTEADQKRVQNAVEEMVQSLEKDNIRKIQGRMFRCGADCCDRSTHTMSQVHQCVERCHAPLAQAQQLVTAELERFQERLIRCTMHCSDKAKDLHDSGANQTAVQALLDRCASSCAEDHVKLIPGLTRKLKENLDSIPH